MTNSCGGFFVFGISYFYRMILSSPAQLAHIPKRIISLVPSQTELLHWLGLEDETIGITKFCVHPAAWFNGKTRIGGTKALDLEKIATLQPDLIIANKEENVKEQVESLAENFPVWITDVENLADAYSMITDIGRLTGKENEAGRLNELIALKFNNLIQLNYTNNSIPAAYLIWTNPIMTVGGDSFISDMMKKAGFNNVFSNHQRYPETTVSELQALGCKLLMLSSEPYPFSQKHADELQKQLPGTRIILVDGEMFSWYGSRLLEAADYFIKLRADL